MMRRMWGLLAVFLLAASAPAAADVSINSGTFPDPQFLNYVETFDGDNDGMLSAEEIARVSSIDVKSKNIQDLKGIKYFTELKNLDCARNQLTALDVSENKKLEHLDCTGNRLTSLDVSENTALMKLYCIHNKLTVLDVSKNTDLGELNCAFNQLTSLNVRENEKLTALFCNNNKLTVLDVSRNTELMNLFCNNNKLTVLDLGADEKIHRLYCQDNVLTSLDVRENTALTELHCHNNKLTVLDVSKNTDLKTLYCNSNHLTFLDLQGLNDLSDVYVGGQTRDGIVLLQSGGAYVLDLGAFIPAEGFNKVSGLTGQASGGVTLIATYTPTSGKARFTTKPDKVTYGYNTGKTDGGNPVKMDVALTVTGVTVDYTIQVTVSGHGRVTRQGATDPLSGDVTVSAGSSVTFVASADAGYEIDYLKVDGAPLAVPAGTAHYEYPFPNVAANHRLEARFKPRPVPPVNPPTPPVNPPAPPADIPVAIAADQWTVFWGTRDAQGSVGVTVQVPINSETPLIASSIRVEASEIWNVRIKLLFDIRADSSSVSAHTTAQNRSCVLQITGTVAESARDTARIDAVHYRLEGSDEEWTVRFGTDGGGILLKDMRKGAEMDSSSGEGGCAAGLGLEMLLVLVPFCIWRRH